MTGLPSQLGYQIVDDICRKAKKLDGCCCAAAAFAIWDLKLPVNIRAHISQRDFTSATYKSVFEAADKVFLSATSINVAAVAAVSGQGTGAGASGLDETLPAFTLQNQPPQVAAVGKNKNNQNNGSGSNKGGQNKNKNKNKNKGQSQGGSQGQGRGPRHSSNPPDSTCARHYRHGPEAWFCVAPLTCPWKDKCSARPQQ